MENYENNQSKEVAAETASEHSAKAAVEETTTDDKKKKRRKKIKKTIIIVVCVLLSIVLALVSTFFILTYIGKKQFHRDDTHISADSIEIENDDTIIYNGKQYTLNRNIINILVIGVDRDNINDNLGYGENGQADVIFVAAIDTKTDKATIIPISRETITDIGIYSTSGKYTGTQNQQICLAYAYGSTPEECSENVMKSVKRLLHGINISSYAAIELDGIAKLTDIVGGISLNCQENFKYDGIEYKEGQLINLKGKLAVRYIQFRGDYLEANNRRMARQKQFLSALLNKVGNTVMNDFTKLGTFYSQLSPYFSSNITIPQLTYLAKESLTMNFGDSIEYKTIEGTLQQGEKWVEFIPNEDSLLQTVIDTFYLPKK